jgi:hypothetical protein
MGIEERLTELSRMSRYELQQEWHKLFGRSAPRNMRRDLLFRFLAYKTQELAFGGLQPRTRKRLVEIARALEKNPHAQIIDGPVIKPGVRLIRRWKGIVHVVTIFEEGYEYKNKRYANLSEIARLITGTRWSGPVFFGLKRNGNGNGHRAKES